tara:strand:+ start:924 stop:1901 length:978 start_codon:yes stop_codon:yes gene_type:complete
MATPKAFSQASELTDEQQIALLEHFYYRMGKTTFEAQELDFRKVEFYFTPWDNIFTDRNYELDRALDTLIATSYLQIANKKLKLSGNFHDQINGPEENFKLSIVKNQLMSANNQSVTIEQKAIMKYETPTMIGIKDGQEYEYEWTTVDANFDLVGPEGKYSGAVTFLASFIENNNYDHINIKKEDKDKEFEFNGTTYKVIDIKSKQLILQPSVYNPTNALAFDSFALDEKGEFQYLADDNSLNENYSIPKDIFDIFEKNPAITLSEFKKLVHDKVLEIHKGKKNNSEKTKPFGPNFIVVKFAGPIENCYLYTPIYSVHREFEIKL